jgi:hypothetical protein
MREVDRIAVEETGPNLYHMMENAGHNPGPRSHGTIPPLCAALVERVEFRWIPHRLLSPPSRCLSGSGTKGPSTVNTRITFLWLFLPLSDSAYRISFQHLPR